MTLTENDYLTFQLYIASKSPRIRRTRLRSWITVTVTFALLSLLFYNTQNDTLAIYFGVLTGLCLTLYPSYLRWKYKRHYLNIIRETYQHMFGTKAELEFTTDQIITRDRSGEIKINKSELAEINEIADYYFIKSSTGSSLIISKHNSEELETIKSEINSLVQIHGVKHHIELDWKWR